MDFVTADKVINDAAVEFGLKSADITDPFGSSDPNILLLCRLLKRLGRSLVRARAWQQLTREYTFPTVASTASYALPSGFNRIKDATAWNRDTVTPLGGPYAAQQWQQMQATTIAGAVCVPFRIFGNLLYLYPTPTAAETIAYEYLTNFWVVPTGQTVPTTTEPTAITDTLWFDESLLVAGLKLAFARQKQMATQELQDEYNQAYAAAASGEGPAPALSLSASSSARLIDTRNLPDTGWGL